ncbi:MAG TPA: phytoene desaturase family protein [Candidatus Binatia bacterium]|nr:phytoene desaturase family protein [Candidatus Binatia bacterium]
MAAPQRARVALIGAGVGGLAAAARLAAQGFAVEVYEKGDAPGGRCGRLTVDGYTFDTGPTLLLMPEVLEEVFAACGRRLEDYLTLHRCDPNYRIHFHDGSDVTFTTELTAMAKELERIEPGSFQRYLAFLAQGKVQYQTSLDRFVGRNFDHLGQFLTPSSLRGVFSVRAHRRMYPEVSRFFKDPRLRAAMSFQTMYLGISPYESPAVYGLLPYTELAMGIWYPRGGMFQLPLALARLCDELGVAVHYGETVERLDVEGGRARGRVLSDGRRVTADVVLCNADLPWAYRHLLDPRDTTLPRADKLRYTSSAFMMYLGVSRRYPQLLHHNVFFGRDYRASFDDIFKRFRVPADPSFYVNVSSRTDAALAPAGTDGLYVLVPVPHRHDALDWDVEGPKLRAQVFRRLAEIGCEDVERHVVMERYFTPDDYETILNLDKGSAFGLSHNFFQVGPFRPANQDRAIRNLFFVGASTQPGTGLPMVMLSARLVTERIVQHAGAQPEPRRLAVVTSRPTDAAAHSAA